MSSTKARWKDPRYAEWRNKVMERDGWKCRQCGKSGNKTSGTGLDAHHRKTWKMFPALRYDVENGVALCRTCHNREHSLRWLGRGVWK